MPSRAEIVSDNDARFAEAIGQVGNPKDTVTRLHARFEVACECARADCEATFEVSLPAYAAARLEAGTFLVAAGHADEARDRLVAAGAAYSVARTEPDAAE
jgi:hypothetical protein